MTKPIILGSQSARRKEILNFFSLPFRQVPSDFDEDAVPFEGCGKTLATTLALGKAKALAKDYPDDVIITADTVVAIDEQSLGKPVDDEESRSMLKRLSGRWHSVYTAVASYKDGALYCEVEETKVLCNKLTDEQINRYMHMHTLHDKAGSYAIQKSGSIFVQKIDGCYFNVMGLPINALRVALSHVGIDLWDYIKELD